MKSRTVLLLLLLFIAAGSLLLDSCRKTTVETTVIPFTTPAGFPKPVYNFAGNPLTEEGFQLGKKLFFDGRLSVDNHHSCASCHQPVAAFTTYEHDRSHGVNNTHTLRNAPGLFNLAWYPAFNQDGSAANLETVYRNHLTSPTEMGDVVSNVLNKVKSDSLYPSMFRKVFGDATITEDRLYKALNQFVLSLVSAGSKYDKMKNGEATFNVQEQHGYELFKAKCNSCHAEPLFTDFSYRNIGLEVDPQLNDYGRMRVTGKASDSLKFRVPSLRNADFTSYYTHDGRINMIRSVLEHYRFSVNGSPTLDPLLANGIQMTEAEEDALVAFIRTLSDSAFLNNPKFRE